MNLVESLKKKKKNLNIGHCCQIFTPRVKIIQVDGVLEMMTIYLFIYFENWSETFIKNEPKEQKQRKKMYKSQA